MVYDDLGGLLLGAFAERLALPISIHKRTGTIHQIAYKFNIPCDDILSVSFAELDSLGMLSDSLRPYICGVSGSHCSTKPSSQLSGHDEKHVEDCGVGNGKKLKENVNDCISTTTVPCPSDELAHLSEAFITHPADDLSLERKKSTNCSNEEKTKRARMTSNERQDKRRLKNLKIQEIFHDSHNDAIAKPFESLILAISPSDFQQHAIVEFMKLTIDFFSQFVEPSGSIVIYSQFKEVPRL